MGEYRWDLKDHNRLFSRNMKRSLPLITIALITGTAIGFIQNPVICREPVLLLIYLTVVIGAVLLGLVLGKAITRKSYGEFRLYIDALGISARKGMKTLYAVGKDQIVKMEKFSNGNIRITTGTDPKTIVINRDFSDIEKLENDLSQFGSLQIKDREPRRRIYLACIPVLLLYTLIKLSADPMYVIPSAAIFLLAMLVSLVFMLKGNALYGKAKFLALIVLLPVYDAVNVLIDTVRNL